MSTFERVLTAITGVVFVILAVPLIARRVRPNWWYGVRTKETLDDEWVWYEANAKSGWGLLFLGAVLAATALADASEIVWLGAALIGAVTWGAWSIYLGRSLHRRREGRHGG